MYIYLIGTLVVLVIYLFYTSPNGLSSVLRSKSLRTPFPINSQANVNNDNSAVFEAKNIIPLKDFDWKVVEPPRLRPFKSKYHLTMGLTNLPISEYIPLDSTHSARLALRTSIIAAHPDITIQCTPPTVDAINELYTWLVSTYLPTRYPSVFTLSPISPLSPTHLINNATTPPTILPLAPPSSPRETLQLLGENIDQDFLILLKDDKTKEYILKAYITCFPSGFNTKEKLGMSLKEIHAPVPRYGQKLELSMDRFFDKIEVGRLVGRANWSITTTSELYTPSGTHLYDGQDPKDEADFDIDDVHLRMERQTLHRLPHTKALVFSFKTYLTPLRDLKAEEEGVVEELAQAIEGLKEGSVPEMWFYKRGVVWGERVIEFLRS